MSIGPTIQNKQQAQKVEKPGISDHVDAKTHFVHLTTPESAKLVVRTDGEFGDKVAVAAFSDSNMGVFASGGTGTGIFAQGGELAGDFVGGVRINGFLNVEDRGRIGGDLHVDRSLFVRTDIQMTGGDYAEDFDVCSDAVPGTVMVIGDEGEIGACTAEYDRRVAGVLSGAGGYAPAIVLDRPDGPQPGRLPLALMGKVWTLADATERPIAIGDLLTTSSTPGHAMKAADPVRAFGAVIGKALRPLAGGRGMVPMLVSLQ